MWFGAVLAGDLMHPRTPGRVPRPCLTNPGVLCPSPPDVVPQNVRRAARAPGARAHREPRHAHARSRTVTPRSGRCEDARRAHSAPSDAGWRHLADSMDPGPSRWTAPRPGNPPRPPPTRHPAPATRPGTWESRLLTVTPTMRSGLPFGCRPMARPPTRPCQIRRGRQAPTRPSSSTAPTPASQRFLSTSPSSSGSVTPQARQGNQGSDSALGTEQVPKGLPGLRSATSDAAARGPVPPDHGWLVDPMTV